MTQHQVIVVGGGAAGCFAAITCAEAQPAHPVLVLERSATFLDKVRISGGGRCNVTHACFDPRELSRYYPRGGRELISLFSRFQPADTINWFQARGVELKTEPDGRMFPVTDSSQTIIDCLLESARQAGVKFQPNTGVSTIQPRPGGGFNVTTTDGQCLTADRVMLATGGCRGAAAGRLAESLGHTIEPPVPSLFTFGLPCPWLRQLAGVAVPAARLTLPGLGLTETGPLLITHWGLSGPAVLRLSAWGARVLHATNYRFPLEINWLPGLDEASLIPALQTWRERQGARLMVNAPLPPLPARLWEQLVLAAGLGPMERWGGLTRPGRQQLLQQLTRCQLEVTEKSLNRDEFVTCGGVKLTDINFKTMESRRQPGLYFGGELLDIDGLTGGFNFQAAWSTGWTAGQAMATKDDGGRKKQINMN